jgi:hypothetical protein
MRIGHSLDWSGMGVGGCLDHFGTIVIFIVEVLKKKRS